MISFLHMEGSMMSARQWSGVVGSFVLIVALVACNLNGGSGGDSVDSELLGTWTNASGSSFEFKSDNTLLVMLTSGGTQISYSYEASGGSGSYWPTGASEASAQTFTYTLSGSTLLLHLGGMDYSLTKEEDSSVFPQATVIQSGTYRGLTTPLMTVSFSGNTCTSSFIFGNGKTTGTFSTQNGKLRLRLNGQTAVFDGGFACRFFVGESEQNVFSLIAAKRISGTPGSEFGVFQGEIIYSNSQTMTYQISIDTSSVKVRQIDSSVSDWSIWPSLTSENLKKLMFTYEGTDYLSIVTLVSSSASYVPEPQSQQMLNDFQAFKQLKLEYTLSNGSYERGSPESSGKISPPDSGVPEFATDGGTYLMTDDRIRFTDSTTGNYIEMTGGFGTQKSVELSIILGGYMSGIEIPAFVYQAAKKIDGNASLYGVYEGRIDTGIGGTIRTVYQQYEINETGSSRYRYTTDSAGSIWGDWQWYNGMNQEFCSYDGGIYVILGCYLDRPSIFTLL